MPNAKDAPRTYVASSSTTLLDAVDRMHDAMEHARDYYRTIARDEATPTDTDRAILDLADAVEAARLLTVQASRILGEGSAQFSRMVATR